MLRRQIQVVDRPVSFTFSNTSPDERVEPITLATTKKHLRFLTTAEDDLITGDIGAARAYFEEQTGRQAITSTRQYALDRPPFQRYLELPCPPLVSIAQVLYDDVNGDEQTWDPSNYRALPSFVVPGSGDPAIDPAIDPYCSPGRIELVKGAVWPATNGDTQSLRIQYVCGYGATAALVPPMIQSLLYLLVGHLHRNRAEVTGGERWLVKLPMGVAEMILAFKYTALPLHLPKTDLFEGWPCR